MTVFGFRPAPELEPFGPDELVAVDCYCDPPRAHGKHKVQARRLMSGGDLRGRVKVAPDVAARLERPVTAAR